jgi:Domain of unknown function (DUF4382)
MRLLSFLPCSLLVAACGPSSEQTGSLSSSLTGPVDVRVAEDFDGDSDPLVQPSDLQPTQIVVTITRVDAKVDGTGANGDDDPWVTLSLATVTVDLLALPSGGFVSLGITQLPAGGIERLRLFTSSAGPNYVVTADGQSHPLVVPSGEVRVTGDFDAEGCAVGQVTLALAGKHSIEVHPLGGAAPASSAEWVLRPVIRVSEAVMQDTGCITDEDHSGDRGDRKHH